METSLRIFKRFIQTSQFKNVIILPSEKILIHGAIQISQWEKG